jgi:sec-independent protein translocase protein TatC
MSLVPFPGKKSSQHAAARDDEIEPYHDEYADRGDTDGARMSFLEHLDELRSRILTSVAALFIGFLIALIFIDRIVIFIMRPLQQTLPPGGKLIYTEPTEAFILYMKMAALAGLILAAPVILWQVWRFVAPGLYANEKRYAIPFVVFATFFFVAGALFSHYLVFPWAFTFFASFAVGTDYLEFAPRIAPIFSLYTKMLLSFGLIFQMPTLVYFLARIGLITPRFLIRNTKYAILIIFIVAAILTPGPDVVSQSLMAGPMILLYGFSILIAWVFGRKPKPDTDS